MIYRARFTDTEAGVIHYVYDEIAIYTSTFKIHSLGNGLTKVGTFVDLPLESFD